MKKLFLSTVLTLLFVQFVAQDTTKNHFQKASPMKYRNEIGISVTPFIKYYLNFNGNYTMYTPDLYLTYRRYYQKLNFRGALGGSYATTESPAKFNGDSLYQRAYNTTLSFNGRIGIEYFQNLAKRWQVFYGADLTARYYSQMNDIDSFNKDYYVGFTYNTVNYGIAPMLGIRFNLSSRVSLITETNLMIQYSENKSHNYYSPISKFTAPKESDPEVISKTISTSYNYPIGIILTISL